MSTIKTSCGAFLLSTSALLSPAITMASDTMVSNTVASNTTVVTAAEPGFAATHDEPSALSPHRMTMGQLVQAVLAQNAGLAGMHAAASAAKARIVPAAALDDPFLSYAFAPATLNGLRTASGESRGLNQRIEFSQSFPWPGKRALRAATATAEAAAAEDASAATALQLIAASKISYSRWYYIHQALALNASNRELLEDLRTLAETRYAHGLSGQQEVLQAELRLQERQQQRLDLVRTQQQLRAQINALLNRRAEHALAVPTRLPPLMPIPDIQVLQTIALQQHPELAALEHQLDANRQRAKLSEKDFLPDFKVFTAYNSLWDQTDKRWLVGVGINLPIGQSKRHAALSAARATSLHYEYQLEERKTQLLSALQQSYVELEQALASYTLYQEQLNPRSRENLSAARAEYSAGGGAFANVLWAEAHMLDAALGTQAALADYFIALAELERLVGGHWAEIARDQQQDQAAPQ